MAFGTYVPPKTTKPVTGVFRGSGGNPVATPIKATIGTLPSHLGNGLFGSKPVTTTPVLFASFKV